MKPAGWNNADIDDTVLHFIRNNEPTFPTLMRFCRSLGIQDAGEYAVCDAQRINVIFWTGLSKPLLESLMRLVNARLVHLHPSTREVHVAERLVLDMPLDDGSTSDRDMWCPVTLRGYSLAVARHASQPPILNDLGNGRTSGTSWRIAHPQAFESNATNEKTSPPPPTIPGT